MTRRFFRATLPTIVWNPKEDRALAEFVNGQFTTEDEEVAETLLSLGYPEIGLDDEAPPMIIPAPVKEIGDVPIMPGQMTEQSAAKKIQRDGIMAKEKKPEATDADTSESTSSSGGTSEKSTASKPKKKSAKKKKAPAKKKSKRSIKRRT